MILFLTGALKPQKKNLRGHLPGTKTKRENTPLKIPERNKDYRLKIPRGKRKLNRK